MRVLEVVTGGEPGGAQRHVADVTWGLRAAGHDVRVVHGGGRWLQTVVGPTDYLPTLTRSVHPRADWAAYRSLLGLITRYGPSVVHAHSSKAGLLARLAARTRGVPAVYTAHGFVFTDPTRPAWERALYRAVEGWAGRGSAAVITISARDAAWARAAGIPRVEPIANGVAVPGAPWTPPPGPPWRVGFLARFSAEKGFDVLVRAVAAAGPSYELVVGGDGPLAARYRAVAAAAGIRATFLGWQADAPGFFAQVHALAIPSWKEGLPYTLLDALGSGVPTVVTDVGAMGDVVRPVDPRLVVPAGDPKSLTIALEAAVEQARTSAPSFTDAARRHIARHFDVSGMVARTAAVLEEAGHEQQHPRRGPDDRGPGGAPPG